MSDLEAYIEAAMIRCPRCGSQEGSKCWEWKCIHGRKGCDFRICARKGERSEPHLERAVAARKAKEEKQS